MFTQTAAVPGANAVYALRIGHGCGGSATASLRVEIPEGVMAARPEAKPGWTISVEHTPLKTPVPGEGGKMQTDRVSAITWTGTLPDDEFDDFPVELKLPKTSGALYFPATQVCQAGRRGLAGHPRRRPEGGASGAGPDAGGWDGGHAGYGYGRYGEVGSEYRKQETPPPRA